MNEWRRGYGPRTLFRLNGAWFTWKSEHPKEERLVELTDDYRDDEGNFIPPEVLAPEDPSDRLGDFEISIDEA